MNKTVKKLISACLAICLLFSAFPLVGGLFAEKVSAAGNGVLQNGALTANADGWTVEGDLEKGGEPNGYGFSDGYLSIWTKGDDTDAEFSISQTVENVAAGEYYASAAIVSNGGQGEGKSKDALNLTLKNNTTDSEVSIVLTADGWDNWDNVIATGTLDFSDGNSATITISGNLLGEDWYGLKNVLFAKQTEAVEAPITVQKVEGLSEDFIHGVDVSSYLSLVQSGVKYYDENGNEQNLFRILKDAGVNYVRLRVWNYPFPLDDNGEFNYVYVGEDGTTEYTQEDIATETRNAAGYMEYFLADGTQVYRETYGAGVCDVDTAVEIGKIATSYGMQVLVDFHYSDFWADPKKKSVPKAWENMDLTTKAEALGQFTEESLNAFLDAGVNVGMVQIGNEINNGMAGQNDENDVYTLLKSGSAAVRKVSAESGKEILIAVHYTDPHNEGYQMGKADALNAAGVDYDVFGTSYYPFWHGTPENLTQNLGEIAEKYNKKVMVAEISYAWTFEDGDGYANVVSEGKTDLVFNYSIDAEGQATAVRDAIAAISAIGEKGLGTFYWEPAWIPVNVYDANAANANEILAANEKAWKLYGSGWGTLFAADYDPEIVDDRNGGTWDNQAFFDFEGNVLPSINVYKWVYTGANGPTKVSTVDSVSYKMDYQQTPELPATVNVNLNDGRVITAGVTWNADEVAALKTADFGEYTVSGSVNAFSYETKGETVNVAAGTWATTCAVTVTGTNYVFNGSFEENDGDGSGWTLTNYAGKDVGWPGIEKSSANAKSGLYYYKAWNEGPIDFAIDQVLSEKIPNGYYTLFAYYQGTGVATTSPDSALYAIITYKDGTTKTYSTGIEFHNVWKDFYQAKVKDIRIDDTVASIQIGTRMAGTATELGIWVTVDDISLMKSGELQADNNNHNSNNDNNNSDDGGDNNSGDSSQKDTVDDNKTNSPDTGDIETGYLWVLMIGSLGCVTAIGLRRWYFPK